MDAFKPLCQVWHEQVKQFFTKLHGHQSKVLAMFVLGAIKAESIVIQRVAEALLAESEAKAPSIERRLERFLSNERIDVEKTWNDLLEQVMPYFRRGPMRFFPGRPRAKVAWEGRREPRRQPISWTKPMVWEPQQRHVEPSVRAVVLSVVLAHT